MLRQRLSRLGHHGDAEGFLALDQLGVFQRGAQGRVEPLGRILRDVRGMTWLPQTLIADDLLAGRLVDAAPSEWQVDLEIRLYRDRSPLGQAAEEFWLNVP